MRALGSLLRPPCVRPWLAAALLVLTATPFAEAALPPIFHSRGARFVIEELTEGRILTEVLTGVRVAPGARREALADALRGAPMRESREAIEQRLRNLERRFAEEFPDRADDIFRRTANAALTREEMDFLRRAAAREMRLDLVEFLVEARPKSYRGRARGFAERSAAAVDELRTQVVTERAAADRRSPVARALRGWTSLAESSVAVRRRIPRETLIPVLADPFRPDDAERLARLFESALRSRADGNALDRLERALARMLAGRVPADGVTPRLARLREASALTPAELRYAMGEMELKETLRLVHGGNPTAPAPESLLGQYLERTGASTVVRRFPAGPNTTAQGEPVLVVALSQASMAEYRRLFSGENFFVHVHTPRQGTLATAFEGKYGTYAGMVSEMRRPELGTLMPHLVLKTSEAQRMRNFARLGNLHEETARHPWELPGYCATGGYDSCTHWFGNIPIGDRRVAKYTFPGRVDEHAYNRVGPRPQSRRLRTYENMERVTDFGDEFAEQARLVWRVPGHEQLADVIGLRRQNLAGELANPGYVAYSLLAGAPRQRMPVVFVAVEDHRVAIPPNFDPMINAY